MTLLQLEQALEEIKKMIKDRMALKASVSRASLVVGECDAEISRLMGEAQRIKDKIKAEKAATVT